MIKYKYFATVNIIALTFLTTGCSLFNKDTSDANSTTPSAYNAQNDVYIQGVYNTDLDVLSTTNETDLIIIDLVYDTLFTYRKLDDITCYLATRVIPNDTFTSYTIKLKDNVYWHDNTLFTADDVIYTFDTILSNEYARDYDDLTFDDNSITVTKIDDFTVQIDIDKYNADVLDIISKVYIIPNNSNLNDPNYIPNGTGSYKFIDYTNVLSDKVEPTNTDGVVELEPASPELDLINQYKDLYKNSIILAKNENYYSTKALTDYVVFKQLESEQHGIELLHSGDINAMFIDLNNVNLITGNNIATYTKSNGLLSYLSFNFSSISGNDITNQQFRESIFTAINKEKIILDNYISNDYAFNPQSIFPSVTNYYTSEVVNYPYGINLAYDLLISTLVETRNLNLHYPNNSPIYLNLANQIAYDLKQIGINVNLTEKNETELYNELISNTSTADIFLGSYYKGEIANNYGDLYTTNGVNNMFGYSNSSIDILFENALVELDDKKREQSYKRIQQMAISDTFILPLSETNTIIAINHEIGGLQNIKYSTRNSFFDINKLYIK